MLWEDKVSEWMEEEVTKAFFEEVASDIVSLTDALIDEPNPQIVARLQGMISALRGVIDMPVADGITNPNKKDDPDESRS